LWAGFASCPPSWREFYHEFRTPADNKVSLQAYKRVQEEICKLDLYSLSVGSSKNEVLYTNHVWKDCLGMTMLFEESPLRR